MKKLLSTMLAAVTALTALATNYTGTLTVTINGESTTQDGVEITVDQSGNDYTLSLNNFKMDFIPVGNIVVTAPGTTANGFTSIVTSQSINITAGDEGEEWIGPTLGEVPINMVLAFNDYAMSTNIDIFMAELGQNINVKFAQDGEATGYQIRNSGFENYVSSSGEPIAWHGFKSAKGSYASMAQGKLESSTDVREGAGHSAVITAGKVLGFINNGTMTTGQLQAGSMSATNTANHSEMDKSSTAKDKNGDPFYTVMHGRPDALKFWIKCQPVNDAHKASVSAIITNGTYYQDPENKEYTNKLASAKNTNIAKCGWTEMSVPFTYIDETIIGDALLITFSTNNTPGQGTSGDQVFVDDIALVYNAAITGITIKGTSLEGFAQDIHEYNFEIGTDETITDTDIEATFVSEHAYLVKKVIETSDGYKVFVAVVSNDFNTTEVYTINFTKPVVTTPLAEIIESGENGAEYTIAEDLAVVDIAQLENHAFVTDGNNNWLRVDFSDDIEDFVLMNAIKGGTLKGTLSNVELNPVFTVTEMPQEGENTVDFTVEKINLADEFTLKSNQVVDATGYWQAANSCLRGYSSGGQSLTINSAWATADNTMENGKRYTVRCAISLKEAWKATAGIAPKDYDYDFQNYQGNMLVMPSTPTAIDAINTNTNRQVEAVYNAQGQRVGKDAKGVLIVRYTDGTVAKVVR